MKKTILGALFLGALILSLGFASAHHTYRDSRVSITFSEDIQGENRGFTLTQTSSVPRDSGCDYYDWSYDGRFCERSRSLNPGYYQKFDSAYNYGEPNTLDNRLSLEAFKTFQRDSQKQLRIEQDREKYDNRYRYSHYPYRGRYYYW